MNVLELVPPAGDRVFFAGQTGAGKTTLARTLLDYRPHVVVLDVKGTLGPPSWPRYRLVQSLPELLRFQKEPRLIYRPSYRALVTRLDDEGEVNKFFRWVYARGHTTVYVDETYGATEGARYAEYYGACLTRGREKGIEVWSGTQRPAAIPQIAMSEAEHAYIFRLRLPQDREKVEAVAGIPAVLVEALHKRQFLYAPQAGDVRGPLTLTIPSAPAAGPSTTVAA